MLTINSALEYGQRLIPNARLSNARLYDLDGIPCVAIDLDIDGEAAGTLDVWVEAGAAGAFLYGEW